MQKNLKLYMVMIGCRPKGRFTEQHDIFFGIGNSLKELIPKMKAFWPEAKGKIHIDAWREVTVVDNCIIEVVPKSEILYQAAQAPEPVHHRPEHGAFHAQGRQFQHEQPALAGAHLRNPVGGAHRRRGLCDQRHFRHRGRQYQPAA